MAKKKVSKKTPAGTPQAPEGFKSVRSASADAYFRVVAGAWIQGVMLGRYPRNNDPGFYYQIRLTQPCPTVQKKDGEGGYYYTDAEVGEVVSVDERALMSGLKPYVDEAPDVLYEAFIVFEEKIKNGARSYWQGDAKIMPYRSDAGQSEDATVPF